MSVEKQGSRVLFTALVLFVVRCFVISLIFAGPDAVLPSKSESQEPAKELSQHNSSSNLQKKLDEVSDTLPPPGRK